MSKPAISDSDTFTIQAYLVNEDSDSINRARERLSTWSPLILRLNPNSSSDIYAVEVSDATTGSWLGTAHYAKGRKLFAALCENRRYKAHVVRMQEFRSYTKVFFEAEFEPVEAYPLSDSDKNEHYESYLVAKTNYVEPATPGSVGCAILLGLGIIVFIFIIVLLFS